MTTTVCSELELFVSRLAPTRRAFQVPVSTSLFLALVPARACSACPTVAQLTVRAVADHPVTTPVLVCNGDKDEVTFDRRYCSVGR